MPVYLIIACVILGGLLFAQVRHSGALSNQLDTATEIANSNAKIAEDERIARAAADAKLAAGEAKWENDRKRFAANRREIANAKPEDDAPLAPVLRRTLDGLPAQGTGAADVSETAPVADAVRMPR